MTAADAPSKMWAFIDEYGNENLAIEKKDVSQHFIIAAVLVRDDKLEELRATVDEVRRRIFQTGEMKSKTLASRRDRWVLLLEELQSLPFHVYALAVDKTRLDPASGFQWKGSFRKNLCGRAYGKILRAYRDLQVRADEHGRTEFMASFGDYINQRHQQSLFESDYFAFVDGKNEILVQLADVMAGLLARVYDPTKRLARPEELLALLRDRLLVLDEWPPVFRMKPGTGELPHDDGPDERIAEYSVRVAETYAATHEDATDNDIRARVAVLERLLFERRFAGGDRAVATGALLDNLRERGLMEKGETWLRRSVIAPLRDGEILITSSPHGYKLPQSKADVLAFVRHAEAVCIPMLNRVRTAAGLVKLATVGAVDVLAEDEVRMVGVLTEAIAADARAQEPEEPEES